MVCRSSSWSTSPAAAWTGSSTARPGPRRAAQLAEQVALGIAEAHRSGIVHRDLKPSNVLLAADGTPKVGDFGLAKMLDSQSGLTRSESVMGSPSYMAPEQAMGHAKEAGPAVDVYAVGAILYELLTGRPPFRGTTALETMEQVKTTEPVPPRGWCRACHATSRRFASSASRKTPANAMRPPGRSATTCGDSWTAGRSWRGGSAARNGRGAGAVATGSSPG